MQGDLRGFQTGMGIQELMLPPAPAKPLKPPCALRGIDATEALCCNNEHWVLGFIGNGSFETTNFVVLHQIDFLEKVVRVLQGVSSSAICPP